MIIEDKKIIYLHIPKCAGKSVEKYFLGKPQINPHNRDWAVRKQLAKGKYKDFYKFTVVRNPIDRVISVYNYYLKGGNKAKSDKVIQSKLQKMDLNLFISELENLQGKVISKHMLGNQERWVYHKGKLLLTHIILFEDLPEDIEILGKKYGIMDPFPHINKSKKQVGYEDLTIRSLKKLKQYYKIDFKLIKKVRNGDL